MGWGSTLYLWWSLPGLCRLYPQTESPCGTKSDYANPSAMWWKYKIVLNWAKPTTLRNMIRQGERGEEIFHSSSKFGVMYSQWYPHVDVQSFRNFLLCTWLKASIPDIWIQIIWCDCFSCNYNFSLSHLLSPKLEASQPLTSQRNGGTFNFD